VTGDGLKARRHAREIVTDMRWRGMTVPPLYARMASEFQDLVRSGEYAAWVAANQTPPVVSRKPHEAGLLGRVRPGQSEAVQATPGASTRTSWARQRTYRSRWSPAVPGLRL
jgi:hypothetical protein